MGDSVKALAFSPDGRWLAAGSDDGDTRLYTMQGESMPELERTITDVPGPINTVAFSGDGRWLATGSGSAEDSQVRLYAVQSSGLKRRSLSPLGVAETALVHTLTKA